MDENLIWEQAQDVIKDAISGIYLVSIFHLLIFFNVLRFYSELFCLVPTKIHE